MCRLQVTQRSISSSGPSRPPLPLLFLDLSLSEPSSSHISGTHSFCQRSCIHSSYIGVGPLRVGSDHGGRMVPNFLESVCLISQDPGSFTWSVVSRVSRVRTWSVLVVDALLQTVL